MHCLLIHCSRASSSFAFRKEKPLQATQEQNFIILNHKLPYRLARFFRLCSGRNRKQFSCPQSNLFFDRRQLFFRQIHGWMACKGKANQLSQLRFLLGAHYLSADFLIRNPVRVGAGLCVRVQYLKIFRHCVVKQR